MVTAYKTGYWKSRECSKTIHEETLLQAPKDVFMCSVLIYNQRIRGFTTMRYINLRFTYLLTYLLLGFANVSYSERLHKLALCSLESQRLYCDLYMCYRIISGQVCMQDFFEFNCASWTRAHPYKLCKCHSYSRVRASYFANRVTNVWNTLPSDHIDFSSFLLHLNGLFSRLTYRRFYYVIRLSCSELLSVSLVAL